MQPRHLVLAAVLLLLLQGCGRREVVTEEPSAQRAVTLLRPGTVARMEVLYFDRRILLRAAMTPKQLEQAYQHKLTVEHFGRSDWRDDLIRALQAHDMKWTAPQK
jgi:hypothetical protein